jgi:hypothetical protein
MNTASTTPAPENPVSSGDAIAAAFLAQELPDARKTLKRTRIIGVALILFIAAYMGTISTIMVGFFEPKTAAEVASGMLTQHVASDGPVLLSHVEREIPLLIRETPDFLIKEIPGFRKQLQGALTADCEAYCNALSKEWGAQMDQYIDTHKPEIRTLLENAGDREAIRKTLPDFDKAVGETVQKNVEGQAAKEHIDAWAAALKEVDKRVDRLANGQNLTPEEIKARHALAMLSTVIKRNAQLPETVPASALPKLAKP